ncbi:MAG: hypothetical protein FWG36_01395 [Oscillospiraceae bacterium]|nr:hypothetical protein [Oscillospiraceae bacterium]
MVKLFAGLAGTGKTKNIIEMVNKTAREDNGQVVCIERGNKLRYDIINAVRLIDSSEFDIQGFQVMRGVITGLYVGNFDITHIFIDSLHKVAKMDDIGDLEKFFVWMKQFGKSHGINFVVSVGISEDKLTEQLREFL